MERERKRAACSPHIFVEFLRLTAIATPIRSSVVGSAPEQQVKFRTWPGDRDRRRL